MKFYIEKCDGPGWGVEYVFHSEDVKWVKSHGTWESKNTSLVPGALTSKETKKLERKFPELKTMVDYDLLEVEITSTGKMWEPVR